jgi:hypothetical protein
MATDDTRQLPHVDADPRDRLRRLKRMPLSGQVAALLRRDYTGGEWRAIHTPGERLELLCGLTEDEQLDALRASCFSLDEWCAFARRHPQRPFMLDGEYAFITVTTPEWCEQ